MKKISINTIIIACFLFIASSCNNVNTADSTDISPTNDSTTSSEINNENQLEEIGIQLMKSESVGGIQLGLGINQVIEILGNPSEKSNPEMWEGDGEYHQNFSYVKEGLELDFIGQSESNQTLNMITVTEPCTLKTKRQIGIGSSIEEVNADYKNKIDASSSNSETIIAGTIYGGIIFSFENSKVKSIFIGQSAE